MRMAPAPVRRGIAPSNISGAMRVWCRRLGRGGGGDLLRARLGRVGCDALPTPPLLVGFSLDPAVRVLRIFAWSGETHRSLRERWARVRRSGVGRPSWKRPSGHTLASPRIASQYGQPFRLSSHGSVILPGSTSTLHRISLPRPRIRERHRLTRYRPLLASSLDHRLSHSLSDASIASSRLVCIVVSLSRYALSSSIASQPISQARRSDRYQKHSCGLDLQSTDSPVHPNRSDSRLAGYCIPTLTGQLT